MADIIKRCEFCHKEFTADHRVAARQRACKSLACQQQRKHEAQKAWVAKNPDYFKGRYPELRRWLAKHPGYLNEYRHRKSYSYDIQDELTLGKTMPISAIRDMQDELTDCVNNHLPEIDRCMPHDIQDKLTLTITTILLVLIYKTRLKL